MKRTSLTKFMALALTGAMLIAPLSVSATEVDDETAAKGDITGAGNVEGIVNKDVFKVVLPTVATGDTTFNFILDPQGLIKDTNGEKYTNATFDVAAKGLYFANPQTDGSTKYMASSPALTAINKGTVAVDVTLTAAAQDLTAADSSYTIGLAADDTFADDKTTSVYLALKSGSQTAALSSDGATITDSLDAAPSDAYAVTYDSTNSKYEYGLTDAAKAADYAGFDSLDFNLSGACNTAADWAAAKDATPGVQVTWTLTKHFEAPVTDGTVDIAIPYTGAKPANGSIEITTPKGNVLKPGAGAYTGGKITVTDSTITFAAAWLTLQKNDSGLGIYSFQLNGKTYSFKIVDEMVSVPSSNGTTDIVISYTGAKPANGSIEITSPKGNVLKPGAGAYTGGKIVVTDNTITFTAAWLTSQKDDNGLGTYTFVINDTSYSFIIG
ncbi:MAG: hypothetical protein NC300_09515 [Bacteroidales bacterium]|nr:hypothetical protein [Clostridium sp.]MCM1204369.1 hypothetical protein [Bacteroidales bacterium]